MGTPPSAFTSTGFNYRIPTPPSFLGALGLEGLAVRQKTCPERWGGLLCSNGLHYQSGRKPDDIQQSQRREVSRGLLAALQIGPQVWGAAVHPFFLDCSPGQLFYQTWCSQTAGLGRNRSCMAPCPPMALILYYPARAARAARCPHPSRPSLARAG